LPAAFSRTVATLRDAGWLHTCVTVGQAYGGDLEAVTVHTGLLAARHVAGCDVAVVAQGPGNLGTGTRWGYSGVAAGEAVNAAATLHGRPVASLRVSGADPRDRHRGISHPSLTAYTRVSLAPAHTPAPTPPATVAPLPASRTRPTPPPRAPPPARRRPPPTAPPPPPPGPPVPSPPAAPPPPAPAAARPPHPPPATPPATPPPPPTSSPPSAPAPQACAPGAATSAPT